MRRLDIYDVKIGDEHRMKYVIRRFVNEAMIEVEEQFEQLKDEDLSKESFFETMQQSLPRLFTTFEFMLHVHLINQVTYDKFIEDFMLIRKEIEDFCEKEIVL